MKNAVRSLAALLVAACLSQVALAATFTNVVAEHVTNGSTTVLHVRGDYAGTGSVELLGVDLPGFTQTVNSTSTVHPSGSFSFFIADGGDTDHVFLRLVGEDSVWDWDGAVD